MLTETISPAPLAGGNGAMSIWIDDERKSFTAVRIPSQAEADLISSLNAARDKLDARVALLNRALDLREQLYFGIDLDDAVQAVAELRRDCAKVRP